MCRICNESLLAGANAASLLARAARDLHDINATVESKILAKAAAELFEPPKAEDPDVSPTQNGHAPSPEPLKFIIKDGIVYLDGVTVGQVVGVRSTKH